MTQTKQQRKSLPCMETKPCQFLIRLACIFGFLAMDGMSASAQFTYDWPDHSALSEGQWVKMATVRTGFHKVDANLISSLGLDPSAVNPNQINLYGHGGDALPIDNADPRPLDLVPVPIEMVDDGDNQFDGNDHFIFMGNGPEQWNYDEVTGKWRHQLNPWSDTAWYYLRIDDTAPVRLVNAPALSGDFDTVLVETDFHLFHELEQSTIIRSGRNFFGEVFDQNPTHTIPFQVPDVVAKTAQLEVKLMGRSVGGVSPYTVSLGDSSWTITPSVTGSQSHVPQAQVGSGFWNWTPSSEVVQVGLTLDAQVADAKGWLDYIRLVGTRQASMSGSTQQEFVRAEAVAPGQIVEWSIAEAQSVQRIWDVTDPQAPFSIPFSVEEGQARFRVIYDELRSFRAGTGSGFYTPTPIGAVQNTDVHSLPQVDLVVITPPGLREAADSLAAIHFEEGLSVAVLEPSFIYDCFSSGRVDPTAFKMLMKMLHDRAEGNPAQEPRYLQLFGDGTYLNRNLPRNGNLLVSFQSAQSHTPTQSYVTDDYFGFLSDVASERLTDTLSIGVGRIPASTLSEAWDAVGKVSAYLNGNTDPDGAACLTAGLPGNEEGNPFGPWRNRVCFVADDFDGNSGPTETGHTVYSIGHAEGMEQDYGAYDIKRIFMDAYPQVATPGGERYPEVEMAIDRQVRNGALLINYIGHGGERGWAHERVLRTSTIGAWDNIDRMPLFFTATCELARFDDPELETAGEMMVMNPNGGAIAMMTTTRVVYSFANEQLNTAFFAVAFDTPAGERQRLGDILRRTKNHPASGASSNKRNFTLLGDVALTLATPSMQVRTSEVNGVPIDAWADTLSALEHVVVKGYISDEGGNVLTDFNGYVYPTVYDQKSEVVTLNNDNGSAGVAYSEWRNRIHAGAVTAENGVFEFEFVVPRDISYDLAPGRISYYAVDGDVDAHGYTENIVIGGLNPDATADNEGPTIALFLNDTSFVNGGTTDSKPVLLAYLEDDQGLNTVGNGIGHDLKMVLDDGNGEVLNDYYQSDLNTYQSGKVIFPMSGIEPGFHQMELKAWDVHNNSAKAVLDFVVVEELEVFLEQLVNYPNPMNGGGTTFRFDHNQACVSLNLRLSVYDGVGNAVWEGEQTMTPNGYRVDGWHWNGRTQQGSPLDAGLYVYRLDVATPEGRKASKTGRLVLLD